MKILVTGATGFIGQHVLNELKDDGIGIRVFSRQPNPVFWGAQKELDIFRGDLADVESLNRALPGVDVVVNLAGELRSPKRYEATNVQGTRNVIELAQKHSVKKIIHLSSVGVVGMQYSSRPVQVDETFRCTPQNDYERTKLESEKLLNEFSRSSSTQVIILRPTNVFGDHHPRHVLLGLLRNIQKGMRFPVAKQAIVNYVYVRDVAHAVRYFLKHNAPNMTVNVGEAMPLPSFVKTSAAICGTTGKTLSLPSLFFKVPKGVLRGPLDKVKALSNCVAYTSDFMTTMIGYKYGLRFGLDATRSYYVAENLL
jgi:nucleoside-diphosphate-sugar epimerase